MEVQEFNGYPLFNDVEDVDIRNYNRAAVLVNIAEDWAIYQGGCVDCQEFTRQYLEKCNDIEDHVLIPLTVKILQLRLGDNV